MTEDLLERLQRREPAALREVRAEVLPRLKAVCGSVLTGALADEVAEDVWTDFLLDHVRGLKHAGAIFSYLRLMAARRCADIRRHQQRHQPPPASEPRGGDGEDPEARLADQSELRELQGRLSACLDKLTDSARRVLRMRFHHEMTQEAIGDAIGVSKQYAGRVIAKSLDALRTCLEARR